MKFVFLRDDDVFSLTEPGFLPFFELAGRYSIPIMYAVIPGRLDEDTAQFLRERYLESPHSFDIVQHGLSHLNHNPNWFPKYEFGPGRDYLVQLEDIQKGMDIMEEFFSGVWKLVFVPPYDGFDEITLKVVRELGFLAFSSDEFYIAEKGLINLPYTFALNDYAEDGHPIPIPFREMLRRYRTSWAIRRRLLGILFHHSALKDPSAMFELELFFRFLVREQEKGRIRLITVSSILSRLQIEGKKRE